VQYFIHSDDVERINVAPGITVRVMSGHSQTMRLVEMAPHAVMPIHSHTDEQSGFVLQGSMELTIDGEKIVVNQGDAYFIPKGGELTLVGSDEWTVFLAIFNSDMGNNEIYKRGA
jgi:quercetin dioxygenase-like cupin family protein